MGFYGERILPHLIRATMRDERFVPYRRRTVAAATGRVLEIGLGAGENLPYYRANVAEIIGIEPSARLAAMARAAAVQQGRTLHVIEANAEALPVDAASFDAAVMTWTLCSIPEPQRALAEIRRVLQPNGRLLFAEHGLAPDRWVQRCQRWITPVWRRLAGGCHLDRDMNRLLSAAGFRFERLETGYMRGPRLMTFMYEGSAVLI